jgi:DNA-binding transcriptional LysR family regulator
MYRPPVELPQPEIKLYWHRRHDQHPAHRWLRNQIMTAIKPFQNQGI